jgi:hypothetical protein
LSEVLIDYYVVAEDSLGNIKRSPIQHVWIGPATGSPSHVIDGSLDSTATLVASNSGLDLYADWDGDYLYIATTGVGETTGWDHFAVVGLDLSTPVSAPWAKAGTVADRALYLGNEDSNNWCGWFDDAETVLSVDVDCASGAYLEGIIRLETYLGTPLPEEVYLAVGAYQSPDGGALTAQAPAGDGDGNIEQAEYVAFPLSTSGIDWPVSVMEIGKPDVLATPNPFTGATRIVLSLPKPQAVTVKIVDLQGRTVTTLIHQSLGAGRHFSTWAGTDSDGLPAAPGLYFVTLTSQYGRAVRKVLLIR